MIYLGSSPTLLVFRTCLGLGEGLLPAGLIEGLLHCGVVLGQLLDGKAIKLVAGGDFLIRKIKMNKVTVIRQEIGQQSVLSFGNSSGDGVTYKGKAE